MSEFRPKLLEAKTASERMDALCEFIEFWAGPRQPTFGEPASSLDERPLPMPLKQLYEFAGRWPHEEGEGPDYFVPAFSQQDHLFAIGNVRYEGDGKIVFLCENQAGWDCRTLAKGDDPPVWCYGDQLNENEEWIDGEKLICGSLSRFLITFVLQEITLGSKLLLVDKNLTSLFETTKHSAVPVWTDGPYVHQNKHHHFLWNGVLVGFLSGHPFFGANSAVGIDYLKKNQGPVDSIRLMATQPWTLDIRIDGSAQLRYLRGRIDENAEAPPDSFNFQVLLKELSAAVSSEGHWEKNPMVSFHRDGQSGAVHAKHLHNVQLVTSLCRRALENAAGPKDAISRRFEAEWPH